VSPLLTRIPSLRAFGHRNFVSVWLGALVSNIGTWMETIAMGIYVTKVTGRAEWAGGIAALNFLPAVVLGPVGGALADRFERRRYLAVGVLVQGLLAGILAVLAFTDRLTVPAVAIISFLNGCAATLSNPAFSALIADSVPPEDLHSALSLNSAQFNVGRIVGPTLAALVLATLGMAWALLINTVSFLAVLVALACVHTAPHAAKKLEGLWDGIVHGVRVAFEDPEISKALGGTLVVAALVAPFIGLVPVYALRIFHQEAATSLLVAMQGAGAVTAALSVGSLVERMGRQRLLQWVMLLIGPMAAWYWLTPSISAAAAAIFGLGALYMMMVTGFHTVCQLRASRELQARVSSLFSMVLGAGYSAGVWLQGALADRIGLRLVTVSSALLFLALVLSWRLLRPRDVQATGA